MSEQRPDRNKKREQGAVRQKGGVSQLMILLNGVILTATVYFALGFFIQDALRDDRRHAMDDARQTISDGITGLGQSVRTAAAVMTLAGGQKDAQTVKIISYAVPGLSRFDYLLWVHRDADGVWLTEDMLSPAARNDAGGALSESAILDIGDFIVRSMSNRNSYMADVSLLTVLPGTDNRVERADPLIRSASFAFVQPLDTGFIAGVSRISRVVDDNWIANRPGIARLNLLDRKTGRSLFSLDRVPDDGGRNISDQNFSITAGGADLSLSVGAGKDSRAMFLEKTPIMMLFFGATLTLIGMLYIRNNQRQAQRLRAMNKALARKNHDLNTGIAERERLNEILRKAEGEYRAIIDSVSDVIFETATDSEILFLNGTWRKLTGFDPGQSMGRKLLDMIHPQDQEEQRRNFAQMVSGQRGAYRSFVRIRTADGVFRAMELALSMLRQDESRAMRVIGTLTDIEERRRAEKALTEAEKKYRTIVENAAGGIYQVTPDGQFLSANPAMARILGYGSTEQMLREIRNAHEDLYGGSREHDQFVRELENTGAVKNFEIQVLTRNGRRIWVNENARAVKDDEGSLLYFEGSMEDITKRKEAELKLREAKIQSDLASRAKSEFLANMSHELRTPLNAIIGFSEIIKDEVLGPLENKQYLDYVGDIHSSGRKLLGIINEILDVSRIEAGQRQLNESVVSLDAVVRGCVGMTMQKAEAARLTIVNLLETEPVKIVGEELAIKQILLNLLSNAVKFTPAGGRVTISHEIDGDGQVRLSVTDTGIGLDEAEIEKALSPFGQIETAFSRSGSGVGLGLTLVDSLIRLHGGRLELFSQKGVGTTATVVFPVRRVVREKDETAPVASKGAEGGTDSLPPDTIRH